MERGGGLLLTEVNPPAEMVLIPSFKRLMTIYTLDVFQRLPEIKANITSVYGLILKLDSTKKIVKKLAGYFGRTTVWATNVGNEHGHVLISILTGGEGKDQRPGLKICNSKRELPLDAQLTPIGCILHSWGCYKSTVFFTGMRKILVC